MRSLLLKAVVVALAASFPVTALTAPPALAADTDLCTGTSFDCLAGTGYSGQQTWGADPGHNCINYVAYRLAQNGVQQPWPNPLGNAIVWDDKAAGTGITVNKEPAVGAIAQWNSGTLGHVAYVESVNGSFIEISEDAFLTNAPGYSRIRRLDRSGSAFKDANFIHFRDQTGSPAATAMPVLTATTSSDGRIEIFYIGGDNAIYHRWQTTLGGSYSSEQRIPAAAKSIAAGRNQDGRIEIFYVGTDNFIWHQWQTTPGGPWSAESFLGGWAKSVAITTNPDGRLELLWSGRDDALWHRWQNAPNAGWSNGSSFGGIARSSSGAANADGRIEAFWTGGETAIWHRWQLSSGGWSDQSPLGGSAKAVAAGRNADGRLEIFYIGSDNNLRNRWQTSPGGEWSAESPLGGSANDIAATRNPDGRIEIFYIKSDHNVWHRWQVTPNGSWSNESWLGGWAKI